MKNENTLLDLAADMIKAKNDAQLARGLEVAAPVISKVRHARLPVGAALVIKLHLATGMAVREIKTFITHGPQQVVKPQTRLTVHPGRPTSNTVEAFEELFNPKGPK